MLHKQRYTFDDVERYGVQHTLSQLAVTRAPTMARRMAAEDAAARSLYHVIEAWKAGWR